MSAEEHSTWRVVKAFCGHACGGAVMFIVLSLIAVGLGKYVHFLEENGAGKIVVWSLTGLEYLIFAVDIIMVVSFLVSAVRSAIKEMKK